MTYLIKVEHKALNSEEDFFCMFQLSEMRLKFQLSEEI